MTDIFKKRLLFSQNFLKCYVLFSREIWIKISFFETRTGIFFQHLVSRDENGNFFILISCFEKETRIWKSLLKVEREKMNLILTRIPEIENSRYALLQPYPELPEASWTATGKTPPAPSETLRMRTRRGHSPVFRDALNSSRFRPEQKLPTDFLMNLLMFVLTCNLALHLWIIFLAADIGHCHRDGGVRYAKSLAIQYFIAINILQNSFI